jgi:hypothetical protein
MPAKKVKPLKTAIQNKQGPVQKHRLDRKGLDKRFYQDKRPAYLRAKLMCRHCRAIYDGKGWQPFEKLDPHMIDELKMSICPACHEQVDHISDGVLHINGPLLTKHKEEIINLLHNTAKLEESRDILNRIERIDQDAPDKLTVYTTKNQLAVELGKKVASAYKGGKLEIKWSKEDKPVEVNYRS